MWKGKFYMLAVLPMGASSPCTIYKKFRFDRQVTFELTGGLQDHIEELPPLARLSQNIVQYFGEKLAPIDLKVSHKSDEWKLAQIDHKSLSGR